MKDNTKLMPIVIVGHVDHGKSTLIGRILFDTKSVSEDKINEIKETCNMLGRKFELGFLIDNLKEEREQGITIDTCQTFFKTAKRDYVIIDAPGHLEFVKNMITGASQAEAAVLIVDAKEGVMDQTKRHAYILSMMGISKVIVVINKLDEIEYKKEVFDKVKTDIVQFLSNLGINPCFIIPVSAKHGDNIVTKSEKIEWYFDKTLVAALDSFEIKEENSALPLRFPVQDIYSIEENQIGEAEKVERRKEASNDLVVGRVESGQLLLNQEVVIYPQGINTKVSSIKVFQNKINEKQTAKSGECIGLKLENKEYDRGSIICSSDQHNPVVTNTPKANLFWMSEQELNTDEELTIRCATQEIKCSVQGVEKRIDPATLEVIENNAKKLANNEVGLICLNTKSPIVVDQFSRCPELGRFVLERNGVVCAGGMFKGEEK